MTVIMKFGGSSVADARAIERVVRIVGRQKRPVVVVSALGGVTDALAAIAALAGSGRAGAAAKTLDDLHARHAEVAGVVEDPAQRSELLAAIREDFAALDSLIRALAILRDVSPRSADAVLASGELLSSRIVTAALQAAGVPAVWTDARQLVVTDAEHGHAGPRMVETTEQLRRIVRPLVERGEVPVLGGFIGATPDGVTTTLGRGGSDCSAAIVGACLDAAEIQIWTDVDGMLTADPRIVAMPRLVPRLSFEEASELAYFGAKVLHPDTIQPAIAQGIPVRILNSRRPAGPGTLITATPPPARSGPLAGLACRRRMTVIEVRPRSGVKRHTFLGSVMAVFERHAVGIDLVTTGDGGLLLAVQDQPRLEAALASLAEVAEVSSRSGLALVCAVGEGLREETSLPARLLAAIDGAGVTLVLQASAGRSCVVIVPEAELQAAVERLHASFFAADLLPQQRARAAAAAGKVEGFRREQRV